MKEFRNKDSQDFVLLNLVKNIQTEIWIYHWRDTKVEGSKTLTLGTMQCNIYYTVVGAAACMVENCRGWHFEGFTSVHGYMPLHLGFEETVKRSEEISLKHQCCCDVLLNSHEPQECLWLRQIAAGNTGPKPRQKYVWNKKWDASQQRGGISVSTKTHFGKKETKAYGWQELKNVDHKV